MLKRDKDSFRDNDRVSILQNDRERNCSYGDVGFLHILKVEEKRVTYCVKLPDGPATVSAAMRQSSVDSPVIR